MSSDAKPPRIPPRWFVRTAWVVHRALYAVTRGRFGLRRASPKIWGMARLTTIGRRSGKERSVIVGYIEDGPNLCTVAMNGWAEPDPAWWLNLQANPNASIETHDGRREVTAREATGEERARLWERWAQWRIDEHAKRRSRETAVVVFEPRAAEDGR